jgi:hypothetical protein
VEGRSWQEETVQSAASEVIKFEFVESKAMNTPDHSETAVNGSHYL